MKAYSLDMRQKIVNTYEAGNTSVRKVAERFLLFAKVRYRNYSNEKERQENYSLVRQKGGNRANSLVRKNISKSW
jgi:transposase